MGSNKSALFMFGGLAAVLILVVYLLSNAGGNSPLDRSAIGTKGLVSWLQANDAQVIEAHRRVSLSEADVDLRILPLHDTDLTRQAPEANSREEQLAQRTQRNIDQTVFNQKLDNAPTLVMLPKWRTGVIMLEVAAPQLLIPSSDLVRLLDQMDIGDQRLIRPDIKLLKSTAFETGATITLYQPQLFDLSRLGGNCDPILSVPEGALVINCLTDAGVEATFLSDPDLMNNHGLTLGANSTVALFVVNDVRLGTQGALYHDTADDILLTWQETRDTPPPPRPRSTTEVSRFFTYPFTLIWLATALVFVIAAWRGLVRFGPPLQVFSQGVGASKTASIAAKAYLLRLTGQDHALLAEYADNKLNALSRDLYGKSAGKDRASLFARLQKVAPNTAADLIAATESMIRTTAQNTPAELSQIMQAFDLSYRSISDELGRISRPR